MSSDVIQMVEGKIKVAQVRSTGVITLDRSRALNAIDQDMVDVISPALQQWAEDPAITQAVIRSTSPRAFCAGGDVRYGYTHMNNGAVDRAEHFFSSSYDMHDLVATFPKPYAALIDGIAMGGGLGVSVNGDYRVVTENASAAMPEAAIGFVPDVGMTYVLPRLVGDKGYASQALATFLGVTGWRLSAADMLWAGLATHHVPAARLAECEKAMFNTPMAEAVALCAEPLAEESRLAGFAAAIEECFGAGDWAGIESRLEQYPDSEFTDLVASHLARANPASVVAAVETFQAGAAAESVREALDNEYAVGKKLRYEPNFSEGIEAVLIDKGRTPAFTPATPREVDPTAYRSLLRKA